MTKKKKIWGTSLLSVTLLMVLALRTDIKVAKYTIKHHKIDSEIRIALIADLHSSYYGEGELQAKLYLQAPDIVLLAGDMLDQTLPSENTKGFLSAVSKRYPTYCVLGNHEFASGKEDAIRMFEGYGIPVLQGDCVPITVRGQTIDLCGIDDPLIGRTEFEQQISDCALGLSDDIFSVLLAHRPEQIDSYQKEDFDLVLAGHAHGGQWRIPVILNGLYSPGQGFFPQYAGGLYELGDLTMVVSRGLATDNIAIPRIFNRPEIVIIALEPDTVEAGSD